MHSSYHYKYILAELHQVGIIAKSVKEEPTYNRVIDSFLAGIDSR